MEKEKIPVENDALIRSGLILGILSAVFTPLPFVFFIGFIIALVAAGFTLPFIKRNITNKERWKLNRGRIFGALGTITFSIVIFIVFFQKQLDLTLSIIKKVEEGSHNLVPMISGHSEWIYIVVAFVAAYILGATPFAVIFTKIFTGKNILKEGTQNPGSVNSFYVGGTAVGILVTICDISKGILIPILSHFILAWNFNDYHLWIMQGMVFFSFFGHCFSPFLKFKGGEGNAVFAAVVVFYGFSYFLFTHIAMVIFPAIKDRAKAYGAGVVLKAWLYFAIGFFWLAEFILIHFNITKPGVWEIIGFRFSWFMGHQPGATLPLFVLTMFWMVVYYIRRGIRLPLFKYLKHGPIKALYQSAMHEMALKDGTAQSDANDQK